VALVVQNPAMVANQISSPNINGAIGWEKYSQSGNTWGGFGLEYKGPGKAKIDRRHKVVDA